MQQEPFSIEAAIIAVTIIFLILGAFIVMIMLVYRKRRNFHIIEKINLQSQFRQELLKAQLEIQEQTLNYISGEIHDNITQVLSFVKLNLRVAGNENQINKRKIEESRELVSQAIDDLRNLSKSLSFEHIIKLGLIKTLEIETERLNKSGLVKADLLIDGDSYSLGEQRDLVLFRIFQEALNNTLKHSGAKHLKIKLQYHSELFTLTVEDDGFGFSVETTVKNTGLGLNNIKNRASLIGAATVIDSSPGEGCCVKITLNPFKRLYDDGNHTDSFG